MTKHIKQKTIRVTIPLSEGTLQNLRLLAALKAQSIGEITENCLRSSSLNFDLNEALKQRDLIARQGNAAPQEEAPHELPQPTVSHLQDKLSMRLASPSNQKPATPDEEIDY